MQPDKADAMLRQVSSGATHGLPGGVRLADVSVRSSAARLSPVEEKPANRRPSISPAPPRRLARARTPHAFPQVLLKDMRVQCRARGLSPAGGRDALLARIRDHMHATGDL